MLIENEHEEAVIKVTWPVPVTLKTILNDSHRTWMRGCILELTNKLKASVIFGYQENDIQSPTKNDISIISDRERYKSYIAKPCMTLLNSEYEKICDTNDKNAVCEYIQHRKSGMLPDGWVKQVSHNGIVFYIYICPTMKYEEWFIPLEINNSFLGAFITGQFKSGSGLRPDVNQLNSYMKNIDDNTGTKTILTRIIEGEDADNYALPIRSEEEKSEFFNEIKKAIIFIDEYYNKINGGIKAQINNHISAIVGGYEMRYDLTDKPYSNDKLQDIYDSFLLERTDFCDGMIYFRKVFKLQQLLLFKPRKYPNKDNIHGIIQAADLSNENVPEKRGFKGLKRDFLHCNYFIDIKAAEKMMDLGNSINPGSIRTAIFTKKEKINKLLKYNNKIENIVLSTFELNDATLKNSALILCYMTGNIDELVGAFVKHDDLQESGTFLDTLKDSFSSISAIHLARRNASLSKYHQRVAELNAKYLKHELGQEIAGMKSENDYMIFKHNEANNFKPQDIQETYPNLPKPVDEFLKYIEWRYTKNIQKFTDSVNAIIGRVNIFDTDAKLELKRMYLYGGILYRLANANADLAHENCQKIMINQNVKPNDPNNPPITADFDLLNHVINNLLRNAIKYGHAYSNIYIDTKIADGGSVKMFNIDIKNYGRPIPEEESKFIFDLGVRSSNATDETGIGFGLFIARTLARQHGGDVNLVCNKKISDFNIPLLELYIERNPSNINTNEMKIYEYDYKRLNDDGDYKKITSEYIKKRNNVFTPLYLERCIDIPTACIVFRVTIPVSRRL
ncbi:MAG: ATP-binding protein [Clostridiales bacterium]|nr:ATP-binding protein [Clostridiales bacterium]